ncbi:MAG TPA: VOC family protein [Ilumatobacter sp.]|nr:VOC family protein [Ilumatobacter sp.]
MTIPQRVSLITLGVADVARATEFYESLGWQRSPASQDSITFFSMQGSAFALFGRGDLAADAMQPTPGDELSFRGVSLAINFESREAVDVAFAEWVAAGAVPVKQPVAAEWGGYSSYVSDLDGHMWELAHNPYSPNQPDGRMTL